MSEHATWERRRAQAKKDERETARPVFGSTVGAVYALRPIHERVAARRLEEPHWHVLAIGATTAECRGCGRTLDEIVERRQRKQRNAATARRRRYRRPVSAKNAARAAA